MEPSVFLSRFMNLVTSSVIDMQPMLIAILTNGSNNLSRSKGTCDNFNKINAGRLMKKINFSRKTACAVPANCRRLRSIPSEKNKKTGIKLMNVFITVRWFYMTVLVYSTSAKIKEAVFKKGF